MDNKKIVAIEREIIIIPNVTSSSSPKTGSLYDSIKRYRITDNKIKEKIISSRNI
jgi:hypothetical protein